jgi:uncharacterized membrane protein YfcA
VLHVLWLIPVGVVLGAVGTLVGAGGGFLLVPLLLVAYPHERPEVVTSISLAVVFFNALSGTTAYARMRRVDYRSGLLFSAATIPGAVIGALATSRLPRGTFDLVFGLLLLAGCVALLVHPGRAAPASSHGNPGQVSRTVVERDGTVHRYTYNPWLGVTVSLGVGFVSSLLGIGGGIIHVPMMAGLLGFPVHIATATSHFTLAIMALTGTLAHVATGTFHHGVRRAAALAVGVLIGAQVGARLSSRLGGAWIMRALAVSLGLVGVRLLVQSLGGG